MTDADDDMLAIDLYCGLGGWTDGLLEAGYRVIGFDIERHDYGTGGYPGQLVIQEVTTLHGSQFKNADLIVASPPCTEYSYMAMPWKRAKQIAAALSSAESCLGRTEFPEGYKGSRTIAELNRLFDACFRIQREACEAAGRYIPMVVENVCGAQQWVGPAKANFGSYYLWGDVGMVGKRVVAGVPRFGVSVQPIVRENKQSMGGSWYGDYEAHKAWAENHIKQGGDWFGKNCHTSMSRMYSSKSKKRKAASAQIAKIPFPLALHIAQCFKPERYA